jgi:transposase
VWDARRTDRNAHRTHELRSWLGSDAAIEVTLRRILDLHSTRPGRRAQHCDGLPEYVERSLKVIDSLNEQLVLADKELEELAAEDPICQRLMSVPGVGPVSSLRFIAAIDDVSRFRSAHAVQGFLGPTPGENSSSERRQRTGITKAGPPAVRRALTQAAWNLRRYRPLDPISVWAAQIEHRRGKFIATMAVVRKLAGVLYALWRDGSVYEPNHVKQQRSS